jgi:GT2 family glycosyltransferase
MAFLKRTGDGGAFVDPCKEAQVPKVTVVIPHHRGASVLRRCLQTLEGSSKCDFEILVVDNGCCDPDLEGVLEEFPGVRVVRSPENLGFAGGCNLGIRSSKAPMVALLNNDTEVVRGWLDRMVEEMERDTWLAAVQPKMRSLIDRSRFDYCGAAGGELDVFGYPFAWGRFFDVIETDQGQYDRGRPIFWATGAATLLRRSALAKVGLLDESFFAHMEEIDLDWRLAWAGYGVAVVPDAVVFHQTGGTLGQETLCKMVLNHRNSLLMILKNHAHPTWLWIFSLRIILETATLAAFLLLGKPKRALAVLLALAEIPGNWKTIRNGRKSVNKVRRVPESEILHRMYRGSAALAYYLKGVRRTSGLGWNPSRTPNSDRTGGWCDSKGLP